MTEDISREPLAHAVLAALARTRDDDDPLGSLARSVLSGESDLRAASATALHGRALDDAFTRSLSRRDDLSPDERATFERQARQLREAGRTVIDGHDLDGHDGKEGHR